MTDPKDDGNRYDCPSTVERLRKMAGECPGEAGNVYALLREAADRIEALEMTSHRTNVLIHDIQSENEALRRSLLTGKRVVLRDVDLGVAERWLALEKERDEWKSRAEAAETVCHAAQRYSAEWTGPDVVMSGDAFNAALQAWDRLAKNQNRLRESDPTTDRERADKAEARVALLEAVLGDWIAARDEVES